MADPICDATIAMMRYSEIPRDFSSDSLRFVDFGEGQIYRAIRDESPPSDLSSHSGGPALPLIAAGERTTTKKNNGVTSAAVAAVAAAAAAAAATTADIRPKKNSIGSISASTVNPSENGYRNYGASENGSAKSNSLPPNSSMQNYDPTIISALRVAPEELAGQITLLDFPSFASIQPDELTSCAWTHKKDKHIVAPNIVAFTRRFNHTSFWTVQEILSGPTPKYRAEIMSHFIKVAKRLFELNNLHSLFAILSAMQSASIYRLSKTWGCLTKKEKHTFDNLADIYNDQNNWSKLRDYLDRLRVPCIPYLGLFLTDLVYIDLAHPHRGGLESEQRRTQMNNILRVISNYQGSDYTYILPIPNTQKYLQSIRYIEELQNIFEDDQYKKSLELEPQSTNHTSSSCSSKESVTPAGTPHGHLEPTALASLNLSPAKTSCSLRLATSSATKFIPGHRKCRSLGSKFRSTSLPRNFHQKCVCPSTSSSAYAGNSQPNQVRCKCCIFNKASAQMSTSMDCGEMQPPPVARHLLDDSVIEDKPASDAASTGSSEGVIGFEAEGEVLIQDVPGFQGCVRRKTMLKDGRKPAVASWQRYWLQIWANSLVYFPPKSFKGNDRSDFKREPCKVYSLEGWSAQPMDSQPQLNTFQLINVGLGTVYKFRTSSPRTTSVWLDAIQHVSQHYSEKPVPANLMSFE